MNWLSMLFAPRRWPRVFLGLCCALFIPVALALDAGQAAPDFTLSAADGRPVQLSALRGKVVYLDFWASWCGPCRQSFPWMNAMHDKYGSTGLAVVGVNVDQRRPDAEKFLAQVPAQFAVAYDPQGTSPKLYAVKGMPSSVLIDPQGRVLRTHVGFRAEDRAELESAIRAALSAK